MDEFDVELLANQLIDTAFRMCRERGIRLTEQARRFLRFAAEALLTDPPRSPKPEFSQFGPDPLFWREKGLTILDEALQDDRISKEMEARESVSFPTLMRVISDVGYRHLLGMGFKD